MSRMREFTLPDLGEGLTEGEILTWLVKVGDTVELNQPIVEVETAKAAVEIPAKWAGQIVTIHHEAGTVVEVGAPIITIDTDPGAGDTPVEAGRIGGEAPGGRTAVLVGYGPKTAAAQRRPRRSDGSTPTQASPPPAAAAPAPPPLKEPSRPPVSAPAARVAGSVLAKPPVRKLARDLGVDLAGLAGSGPSGSITRDDVQAALDQAALDQAALNGSTAPAVAGSGLNGTAPGARVLDASRERRIPVRGVRKLTAQNMVASAFTAPHVTMFHEVDVTRSMRALEKLKARRDWQDVKVSPLLLAARAILLAARRHPMINSSWSAETNEIIVKDYVNLGIAAATERGLIVPNIKDAGQFSLRELAVMLGDLIATARAGRTTPEDMSGGTFSITNVGVFGIDTGTPILPPGETAILCLGAIQEKPWAHKGKIKIRHVTTLGLSFDHRIVDGELGSRFLADVAAYLNDPEGTTLAWS